MFRVVRVARLLKKFGMGNMLKMFLENRAQSALLTILFLIILVLEFGGISMVVIEANSPNGNIKTASDAVWYIFVTITTVGYGDFSPKTDPGKLFTIFYALTGIGIIGAVINTLNQRRAERRQARQEKLSSTSSQKETTSA